MMLKLFTVLLCIYPLYAAAIELSGLVTANNKKAISSRYMGFIKEIYVEEGMQIKKGMSLLDIDSKEIDVALAQAQLAKNQAILSLQVYENNYKDIQVNHARQERLYQLEVISKVQFEQITLQKKNLETMMDIARKQVEQTNEQIKSIKNQYNYLNLKSPYNAIVIQKRVEKGEMALPGAPLLILSEIENQKIELIIGEKLLSHFYEGKKVYISIPSVNLECEGKISVIIPDGDAISHNFKAKIDFYTTKQGIYPGMYVIVKTED